MVSIFRTEHLKDVALRAPFTGTEGLSPNPRKLSRARIKMSTYNFVLRENKKGKEKSDSECTAVETDGNMNLLTLKHTVLPVCQTSVF